MNRFYLALNSKKAQDMEFNYIYLMIVGGLILLFTITVSQATRSQTQKSTSLDALKSFDNTVSYMQNSNGVEGSVPLSGLTVQFDYQKDYCNFYTIRNSGLEGNSVKDNPFFAPNYIDNRMMLYSLPWEIPFSSSYFLYATSPKIAYVFITTGNDDINELYNIMPNVTKTRVVDSADFKNQNYDKVRFITKDTYFPNTNNFDSSMLILKDKDITLVKLDFPNNRAQFLVKNGNSFTSNGGNNGETYFIDQVTALASIYSDTPESYECNLMKAVLRLNMQTSLLLDKIDVIQTTYDPRCHSVDSRYSDAKIDLLLIQSTTNVNAINSNMMRQLSSAAILLSTSNQDISREGCPSIY
jgi:hypothetical protein